MSTKLPESDLALVALLHGPEAARAIGEVAASGDPEGANDLALASIDPSFLIDKRRVELSERKAKWESEH